MRTLKSYSLSKFQFYDKVLSIRVTILHVRTWNFFHLNWKYTFSHFLKWIYMCVYVCVCVCVCVYNYFCFTDYAKAFDWVDHNKLWKTLKEVGTPDHLTCLLRNLYAGQEATVRTGHGTTDWFQIREVIRQGCILSPCLLNLYAEYIMQNAGMDEAQAGIKIARRNINNLRYTGDTTLMAESEELKSLLVKVKKGEWNSWLKTQHSEK